ncbi:MAG TPA: UDP-glucose/GDP-mannose dehydrogenase family protein [Caulobacteraceae bacterium]|jgi:UDPglucose 6-dehydrogenase|nr:UDP-glucose/GDP-mannose dehydrogenase family protein [Caulobacteraceae bacterium]
MPADDSQLRNVTGSRVLLDGTSQRRGAIDRARGAAQFKVALLGTGYVGLVTGACFADFGHKVTCVDKDADKIERLKAGVMPIYEPGLDGLVARNVRRGRLSFSTDTASAVAVSDVVFICVGTPCQGEDGGADLSYVYAAAEEIAPVLDGFTVVATKSTVPVGAGDSIEAIIRGKRPDADVAVVSNPEFLREGAAIEDFQQPERVVIGVNDDDRARAVMAALYRPLSARDTPVLFTDRRTSELTKYASNAFLAMKVAFINEMADLCEVVDADVQQIARGMGLDSRIGSKFLQPGPGFGGSCFPKDTLALARTAVGAGARARLVEAAIKSNDARKPAMAGKVIRAMGEDLRGKTIGVLGLTFKPNTDDMRAAPSLDIIPILQGRGARIQAFDPSGCKPAAFLNDIDVRHGPYEAADQADCLLILTAWDQFRALDLDRLKSLLRAPLIVDLHNIYPPAQMTRRGYRYVGIGRSEAEPAARAVGHDGRQGDMINVNLRSPLASRAARSRSALPTCIARSHQ